MTSYDKAVDAANRIDPAHTSSWKLASTYALLSIAESLLQRQPTREQPRPQTNDEILTLAEVAAMTLVARALNP